MKILHVKWLLTGFAALALLAGCTSPTPDPVQESQVRAVVEDFGGTLGLVSLLSPTAPDDIRTHYGPYVSPDLLEQWANDPSHAPGRLTSSPWPDRIEVDSVTMVSPTEYSVAGRVVEITSVEATSGGSADEIPVEITVDKIDGAWLITGYVQEGNTP